MKCPIRPLYDGLVVEQYPEEVTFSNDIVLTKDERTFRYGVVLSVGNDAKDYKVGDTVMYPSDATYAVELDVEDGIKKTYNIIFKEEYVYVRVS